MFATFTKISEKKYVEWENKGNVSLRSKNQNAFERDPEDEIGEGLVVKVSKLGAVLQQMRKKEKERSEGERERDE